MKKKTKSTPKLKFAFYWAASCGGCEIAVLDINERILDVVKKADIVFWPVALDFKYKDLEKMPDKHIDVCFFNGGIRTSENEHLAKLLRKKSKFMVAFGSCACSGSIPALANLHTRESIFRTVYEESPSTKGSTMPKTLSEVKGGCLTLPEFYPELLSLSRVVDVDYYLPGCPPPVKLIGQAVDAILKNKLPEKGAVLAPAKSVCDECGREKTEKKITEIKRVHEIIPDPEKCLLEQGIICLGPATRAGCEARCLNANMPCAGCMGPCPDVLDQGSKMISALGSILGKEGRDEISEKEAEELISSIKDPVGTFYKFTLAGSLAGSLIKRKEK
ncbi:MAG: oxidoreductase [bacterium]